MDDRYARYQAEAQKRRAQLTDFGDDALVFAGAGYSVKRGEKFGDHTKDPSLRGQVNSGPTRYFNVKGEEIDRATYLQGRSSYGANDSDITQSFGYGVQKITTDQQKGAWMDAFERQAKMRGWTGDEVVGAHQGATYPLKGRYGSMKHAIPTWGNDGNLVWNEIGSGTDKGNDNYHSFALDKHKTVQAFQLSEMREQDWQDMYGRQQALEAKLNTDPNNFTERDQQDLAMTYELFDAGSQRIQTLSGEGGDEKVVAAGAGAGAQSIITNAVNNRGFRLHNFNNADNEKAFVRRVPGTGGSASEQMVRRGVYTTGPTVE